MFDPFDDVLARLPRGRFPTVEEIDRALSPAAGVHFETASARPRRGPRPTSNYDARIAEGFVPTRAENLHDLMNAIVWAAFPRSKRAVHALQLGFVRASENLATRTGAHDTLAMLDEGGVLFAGAPEAPSAWVVFGHAILAHAAERSEPVYGLGVALPGEAFDAGTSLAKLDEALEGMLHSPGRFESHRGFPRVQVGDGSGR